jgi:phosphoglycerate dehydrogenase-like enzyme
MTRIAILDDYQGAALSAASWGQIDTRASVEVYRDTLTTEDDLAARLAAYEILVLIRERTRFPASLLARLPALELLALTGRNLGQVDAVGATERGILLTDTEGSGASPVELTIGLMLAVARRIPQEAAALRSGRWQTSLGVERRGKTLGILGLGRIGSRIAAFGQFLGMRVCAWGPTLTDERAAASGVTRVPLDRLFHEGDVVSVHLRLSDTSRGLVTADLLRRMKPTAFLINTARGPIVDEAALLALLSERRIAGAGLDVYDVEPMPAHHPLLGLDNVVLTPHLGYVTQETYRIFFRQVVENIAAYLDGRMPPRCINPEAAARRRPRLPA